MLKSVFRALNFFLAPLRNRIEGRSSKWPAVRKQHLLVSPTCQACGARTYLEVHHVRPFHLYPELELDQENLITLCASPCHLIWGHLGDFKAYNPVVREDVRLYLKKRQLRPYGRESA